MRWCGLRNSEVAALRWGWFVRGRRGPVLELVERVLPDGSRWEPKGRSGTVPIRRRLLAQIRRALRPAFAQEGLRRAKPELAGFVIPRAHGTDAAHLVERRINEFVRPFLPDRQKGAYELRKQFGAEIAMRDGLEVASRLLRHGAITTTWAHYHALVNEPEPL
jgi:integrase